MVQHLVSECVLSHLCGWGDVFGEAPQARGATLHSQAVAATVQGTGRRRLAWRRERQQENVQETVQQSSHHIQRQT